MKQIEDQRDPDAKELKARSTKNRGDFYIPHVPQEITDGEEEDYRIVITLKFPWKGNEPEDKSSDIDLIARIMSKNLVTPPNGGFVEVDVAAVQSSARVLSHTYTPYKK